MVSNLPASVLGPPKPNSNLKTAPSLGTVSIPPNAEQTDFQPIEIRDIKIVDCQLASHEKLLRKIEKVFGRSFDELELNGDPQAKLQLIEKAYPHVKSLKEVEIRRCALKLMAIIPMEDLTLEVRNGIEVLLAKPQYWQNGYCDVAGYYKSFRTVFEALLEIDPGNRGDILGMAPYLISKEYCCGALKAGALFRTLALIPREQRTIGLLRALLRLFNSSLNPELTDEILQTLRSIAPRDRCDVIRKATRLFCEYGSQDKTSDRIRILEMIGKAPKKERKALVQLTLKTAERRKLWVHSLEVLSSLPSHLRTGAIASGIGKLMKLEELSMGNTPAEGMVFALSLLPPTDTATLLDGASRSPIPYCIRVPFTLCPFLTPWSHLARTPKEKRASLKERVDQLLALPGSEAWKSEAKVALLGTIGNIKETDRLDVLEQVLIILGEMSSPLWTGIHPSSISDTLQALADNPKNESAASISQAFELSSGPQPTLSDNNRMLRVLLDHQDHLPPMDLMKRMEPWLLEISDCETRAQKARTFFAADQEELQDFLERLEASSRKGYLQGLILRVLESLPDEGRTSEVENGLTELFQQWDPWLHKIEDFLSVLEKLPKKGRANTLVTAAAIFKDAKPPFFGPTNSQDLQLISLLSGNEPSPMLMTGVTIFAKLIHYAEKEGDKETQAALCDILSLIPATQRAEFVTLVGPTCKTTKKFQTVLKILRLAASLNKSKFLEIFQYSYGWAQKNPKSNLRFIDYMVNNPEQDLMEEEAEELF